MTKAGIFVWNVRNDYTNGRIPIDDSQGAMSVCLFKVNDGLEFQTYSPEDSARWANEVYRPQGIDWMPWGVARGWDNAVAREEGRLAGRHAAASGSEYLLDLEPDKRDYWQCLPGTAHEFCAGYEETSNGLKLRLVPDARPTAGNLLLQEWAREPVVGIWHPQIYSRAFSESLDYWLLNGAFPIASVGVPLSRIYPVLAVWEQVEGEPSVSPDQLEADIQSLAAKGYGGFALWRRGLMSSQQVERLLAMPDPFAPVIPTPDPPVDHKKRALALLEQATLEVEAIP